MKIVFIGQKGIPMKFGGVEKHVDELATRLADRGHQVLAYTRPNYTDKKLKIYKGVELISRPVLPTKHLDAIAHTFFCVVDVIFRKNVDVVHFHSIGPSFMIILLKIFKPRTPVVSTFHSQCYNHEKWGRFARFSLQLGEFVCCNFSDELITVSEDLKRYAKQRYGCEANYIPNGVPLYEKTSNSEIVSRRWGLERGEYILYVGRILRIKGLHYLVEAFNKVNTYKKLVIVGDGKYSDGYAKELRKMASKTPNIIFTGVQNGKTLEQLYSNAYMAIQPSEIEGMSISLLEALSYGLPVLMSGIAGNFAAAGKSTFVFESKDAVDLQKKLQYVLDNPVSAKKKGLKGKTRAQKYFAWEGLVLQTEQVYQSAKRKNVKETKRIPRLTSLKKIVLRIFF